MVAVITFFMLVTDRDMVIADYSVRSYAKITDIPFKLVIYSNWVLSSLRERYFTEWRKLPYVEIWENPEHTDDRKPQERYLYGPFELCYTIWDRELKKLTETPYHATVDADFEILDPDFIYEMMKRLEANPKLVAMSAEYNPKMPEYFDSFSAEIISLNERWQTQFCIYKREALACPESHIYHVELQDGPVPRSVWDDAGYFQRALKLMGYQLEVVDPKYAKSFIHYAAFVMNRDIDERNVAWYRRVQLALHRAAQVVPAFIMNRAGWRINRLLFPRLNRDTFAPGWGEDAPGRYRGHPDVIKD
jgi:hypothetical protein